jgi:hypothetical protein
MPLSPGSLSQVSVTAVSDSLLATAPTGGTTPYSYQWYRATSSGFVPASSNAVSGATALTLNDSNLTPKTIYYYLQVQVDSAGTPASVTTSQLAVTTLAPQLNLSLANIFNISIATPQVGVGAFNTSNLVIFSREAYAATFGTLGYQIYLSPTQVGVDFGSSSNTFAMANAIFSQQPNILANGGYLVVIPYLSSAQTNTQLVSFPATPASGTFELSYNGSPSSAIQFNANAAAVQTAVQSIGALSSAQVSGSVAAGFTIVLDGVVGVGFVFTIVSNSLADSNNVSITPLVTLIVPGSSAETLDQAILRTEGLVQYFGVMTAEIPTQQVQLAAARVIQPINKLLMLVDNMVADIMPGGTLDLLRSGGFTQSRGLYYGDILANALIFMAGYSGRGFSTNFSGSNTTQTMHLKTLAGVQPDPSLTQSYLNLAVNAGADVYGNFQGVPKVFTSGANDFFDNQYNLQWFVGALLVAEVNSLAQTNTKIPQTEQGMDILKAAARQVSEQGVTNGFVAPGKWTNPSTFGNQADFLANIAQYGYYIYSVPLSQQSPAQRAARQAPLVQVAVKFAGAVQSGSMIVFVNP